jgi:organic radical activating enzyme
MFDVYDLQGDDPRKTCFVKLVITRGCNQKCHYCLWNSVNVRSTKILTMERFENIVKFMKTQDREFYEFTFYGGEPTLNPYLHEMVDRLISAFGKKLRNVTMLTNLSKDVEYYERFPDVVRLITSLHTEECDVNEWIEKAIVLKDRLSIVKVVLCDENLKDVLRICDDHSKKFVPGTFTVQTVYQASDATVRECERLVTDDTFVTDGKDTIDLVCDDTVIVKDGMNVDPKEVKNVNSFQGMLCSAGFWIMENGDVHKCAMELKRKPIMNLYDDGLRKLFRWSVCEHDQCLCEERFLKISPKMYSTYISEEDRT